MEGPVKTRLEVTGNYLSWNFARFVGMSGRKTLICRTWALSRMSPSSRLSTRLKPFEYTTVKSGTSSPGRMTLLGAIVQF